MAIIMNGMDQVITLLEGDEILWAKKREALRAAALDAEIDATEASQSIKDTGMLEKSWKSSFYSDDGVATARVYSKSYHDIYNELGSPRNMFHVGFFSRTIDRNKEKYIDTIIKGVFG